MTQDSQVPSSRRRFFRWLTWLTGALAAAAVGIPYLGYLLGSLRKYERPWVPLGPITQFPEQQTRLVTFDNPLRKPWDGMTAATGVYVRYLGLSDQQHQFLVFAVNCTHLGCPVSWFPQSGLFLCPCHGGVYYETGEHASGPPPRGLFHCVWRVKDGRLEVQAPHLPTLHNSLRDADA